MKWIKKVLFIIIVAILFPVGYAAAFQHEPTGFRDLQFGMNLVDVLKTHHIQPDGIDRLSNSKRYLISMPADAMHFRDIPIRSNTITGVFWKNQLHTIQILFPALTKEERDALYEDLLGILATRFGNYGDVRDDKSYDDKSVLWFGEKTNVDIRKVTEKDTYFVEISFQDQLLHKQAAEDASNQDF